MAWERPALETDPDAATMRILEAMSERMEGWSPYEGALEVVMAEEIGREIAAMHDSLAERLEYVMAGFGETVYGVPAHPGSSATVQVLVTVAQVGDEIPVDLIVSGTNPDGTYVAFTLNQAVTATTNPQPATFTALESGVAYNGVSGQLTVSTATATVVSAVASAPSSGGTDVEDLLSYLDRLTDWLTTLRPGGVRAEDLAILARGVQGVHRALGIDLYDPTEPGILSERTATIVPVDEQGNAVDSATGALVRATLESVRELNFVIHVAAPTYTGVDVVMTATAVPGTAPGVLQAGLKAAIASHLSPATWGAAVEPETWIDTPVVRYLDLVRAASGVPGLANIVSLTLNGGTSDVPLSGAAPLPASLTAPVDPTTIVVTVV